MYYQLVNWIIAYMYIGLWEVWVATLKLDVVKRHGKKTQREMENTSVEYIITEPNPRAVQNF